MGHHHFLLLPKHPSPFEPRWALGFWNPEHISIHICVSSFETMWSLTYQINVLGLGSQPNLYHTSHWLDIHFIE